MAFAPQTVVPPPVPPQQNVQGFGIPSYGSDPTANQGAVVPAAVAARMRKDAKREEKRKVGLQLLNNATSGKQTGGAQPPPPQNSTSDAVPQMAAPKTPVPQENVAPFQPAQYKAPNKGLEYLAAALAIFFPGAPIAKLASNFAGGLERGAQQGYQRNEQQAEQKYNAGRDQADVAYRNQQGQRQGEAEQNDIAFKNATVQYQAQQDLRSRGIDPKTGKPFILPPQLARPLPAGAGALDHFKRESQMAQWYTSLGATAPAAESSARAAEYQRQVIDDANNARALNIALYNNTEKNSREARHDQVSMTETEMREEGDWARHADTESGAYARELMRERHEDARATQGDAGKRATLKEESLKAGSEFYSSWAKAIRPPVNPDGSQKLGPDGAPIMPDISPQMAQTMSKLFSSIDRDTDPATTAQHYVNTVPNLKPAERELLLTRGRAADLTRRSQGSAIIPHAYAKAPAAGAAPAGGGDAGGGTKTITAAGIHQYAQDHSVSEDQARKDAEAHGYTVAP